MAPKGGCSDVQAGRGAVALATLVNPDQFTAGDQVSGRSVLDIHHFCRRRQVEPIGVEGEQLEMIMMRSVTLWRAGAAIARLAEIVDDFGPGVITSTIGAGGSRDVVHAPVSERAARSIRIVDHQRETPRARRR